MQPDCDLVSAFCNPCTAALRLWEEEVPQGDSRLCCSAYVLEVNMLIGGENRVTGELMCRE